MLGNRKLILDTFCEVYDLLNPWSDGEFWDLNQHDIVPDAIYMIGRMEFNQHRDRIRQLIENDTIKVILSNPAEGSDTLKSHCEYVHRCTDLVLNNHLLLVGGGDMDPAWPCLQYDSFLPKILDYEENLSEIQRSKEIFQKTHKPYKFLFLNGRLRLNRKYLVEYFDSVGLLDQGLWTYLDSTIGSHSRVQLIKNNQDLMLRPRAVQYLPTEYEVPKYQNQVGTGSANNYVKQKLFNEEWGEVYLYAPPYIDTYFSIVTETVFTYPYSFRTEKIWKPIAMGHPWICAANRGYYKDMKNLGFQTFSSIIDESFDMIENDQTRINRLATVVEDLCSSDLPSFLAAAEPICKYNQQHLAEMRPKVRKEFPERFFQFLKRYRWMT